MRVTTPRGERLTLAFSEKFQGYTGGLFLGSLGESSYRLEPDDPSGRASGFFCAEDFSILLRPDSGEPIEYAFGWSENFGTGPDGVPLAYTGGAVVDAKDGLLLSARNEAAPFAVERWLLVTEEGLVVVRTRIANASDRPIRFDAWWGDDPWVGEYGTAKGDVGWTPEDGLIRRERSLPPERARAVGIADVGSGETAARAANVFRLGDGPPPDRVLVAGRFAHRPDEIDETRSLEGARMVALNVGWIDRKLAPGESLELRWALGRAEVGATLRAPDVPPSCWSRLAAAPAPARRTAPSDLSFVSEVVELDVAEGGREVEIVGHYQIRNNESEPRPASIYFPFAIDEAHPFPESSVATCDSSVVAGDRLRDGIVFRVLLSPGDHDVGVQYRQRCLDSSATYIVTSANAWRRPLERAVFRLRLPSDLDLASASYPLASIGGGSHEVVLAPFQPTREVVVRWRRRQ